MCCQGPYSVLCVVRGPTLLSVVKTCVIRGTTWCCQGPLQYFVLSGALSCIVRGPNMCCQGSYFVMSGIHLYLVRDRITDTRDQAALSPAQSHCWVGSSGKLDCFMKSFLNFLFLSCCTTASYGFSFCLSYNLSAQHGLGVGVIIDKMKSQSVNLFILLILRDGFFSLSNPTTLSFSNFIVLGDLHFCYKR